jgi:hypothetical protein
MTYAHADGLGGDRLLVRLRIADGGIDRVWSVPLEMWPEGEPVDPDTDFFVAAAILPDGVGGATVVGRCNATLHISFRDPCNFLAIASAEGASGADDDRLGRWDLFTRAASQWPSGVRFEDAQRLGETVVVLAGQRLNGQAEDVHTRHLHHLLQFGRNGALRATRSIPGVAAGISIHWSYYFGDQSHGRRGAHEDGRLRLSRYAMGPESHEVRSPELILLDHALRVQWRTALPSATTSELVESQAPALLGSSRCAMDLLVDRRLARVSIWGFQTNTQAGACAGLAADACHDGDPCTVDGCEPDVGCVWRPAADGDACADGATCRLGACVPEAP